MSMSSIHQITMSGSIQELINAIAQSPSLINSTDEKGMTPLHKAASANGDRADEVLVLLNYGADPNIKDNDGWTPLDWADFFVNRDVVMLLACVTDN